MSCLTGFARLLPVQTEVTHDHNRLHMINLTHGSICSQFRRRFATGTFGSRIDCRRPRSSLKYFNAPEIPEAKASHIHVRWLSRNCCLANRWLFAGEYGSGSGIAKRWIIVSELLPTMDWLLNLNNCCGNFIS